MYVPLITLHYIFQLRSNDVTQTGWTSLHLNDKAIDLFSVVKLASVHKALFIHLSKLRLITIEVTAATQLEKPVLPSWCFRSSCKELNCKQRTDTDGGEEKVASTWQHNLSRLFSSGEQQWEWGKSWYRGEFTSEFIANEQSMVFCPIIALLSQYYIWKIIQSFFL